MTNLLTRIIIIIIIYIHVISLKKKLGYLKITAKTLPAVITGDVSARNGEAASMKSLREINFADDDLIGDPDVP